MSRSTILSECLVKNIGSSVLPVKVHDPDLVIYLEFEPFENPTSSIDFAASDLEVEPLGSPVTSDYDGGLEFSKEGPLGDDPSDDTSRKDDSPLAHVVLVIASRSPPVLPAPIVQPGHELPVVAIAEWVAVLPSPSSPLLPLLPLSSSSPLPSLAHSKPSRRRSRPSLPPLDSPQPSSPPCKRCKVSSYSTPSSAAPAELAAPASAELALTAPTLPSIPIDLLPSRKSERRLVEISKRLGIDLDFCHTPPRRNRECLGFINTSVANNTSGLVPQRQKASDYDNLDPIPQRQDVYSSVDTDVPSQQELDLLFGHLYDEFFNAGSNPSMKIPSTLAPSTHTNVYAKENNNDQAEEGEQLHDDEFTNPFCPPTQEEVESSSQNIDGFIDPDHPEKVCHLRKALYRLKQAPRA
nr:hypothetical protein [Tanacetum cinerariifolium]